MEGSMGKVRLEITTSLDGFITGPDPSHEEGLGKGGEALHEWVYGLKGWRESHGLEGGEVNADSELLEEGSRTNGAVVMGRRMFSMGSGPWQDDPNRDGWWGDEPPFGVPVFIVTHHQRESEEKEGGTTFNFVTDGVESAIEQAREAAGDRWVTIAGGANVFQQALAAGLVNELNIHVAPLLLGGGTPLFDNLDGNPPGLEIVRTVESPNVTHVTYRVKN
jgi:dihydrofolate reductase